MKTIWKFELPVHDETSVVMPRHSRVLDVQASPDPTVLWLWAEVDNTFATAPRAFSVRGTGHPLDGVGAYIATVPTGMFVWHIFEARRQS